jgi:hypothetical protein
MHGGIRVGDLAHQSLAEVWESAQNIALALENP